MLTVQKFLNYLAVDQKVKILQDKPRENRKDLLYKGISFDLMDGNLHLLEILYVCSSKEDELVLVVS